MTQSRARLIGTAAAAAAAGSMLLIPAVAHADGTKDPRYSHPPKKSQPDEDGAAPINDRRAPVKQCGQRSQSGGYNDDPSYYPYQLAPGTTSIDLDYDTINIPDKFDVLLPNGRVLESTGWRGSESANSNNHPLRGPGDGVLKVDLPANTSRVEIRVTTDISGTAWNFTVGCVR
ncbi:hypothetical protein C6V83_01870 [Gordonia iterans]|uniref:Uncharacterized protein n=1 Tax=Gordonia iterans TaxID=1004901 RepID=A0A2S0KC66_9ACTN|nr:hypothetical protein [Gordonia iterans]AVL99230.1 hypothetical protein C6V83_01870 [Gordonia iterans]